MAFPFNRPVVENVVENEDWILQKIKSKDIKSAKDYAVIADISPRTAQRRLMLLKNAGKIRHIGPDKGGYWEVIKK